MAVPVTPTPRLIEHLIGLRVWDVAAGKHSLSPLYISLFSFSLFGRLMIW